MLTKYILYDKLAEVTQNKYMEINMKNKVLVILFALLTTLFILTLSINASDACNHESKEVLSVEYTDYAQKGKIKFECPGCDVTEKEIKPLLTLKGYSISNDGGSLCTGYTINSEALSEITKLNGNFEIGMVAAAKSFLGDKMPLDSKTGEPVDLSQYGASVIKANITNGNYATVDLRLNGFKDASYYEQLYLGAYVFDGEAVKYIQGEKQAEDIFSICYLEATGKTETTIDGYTFSLIKETKDADDRIKQMNNSKAKYKAGTSASSWDLFKYQAAANAIVVGGSVAGYENAKNFLSHYLNNTGKQYTIDLNSFFKDSDALNVRNKDINRALRAAEELAIENATVNVNQCMEQVNHNLTGDWKYSLGSYFSRINMGNVTVTEENGTKIYSATLKYTVTDFYNWDEADGNKVFGLISPWQLAQLHRAGRAQEFLSVGEISYEITWTEGQTVDQISGIN